MSLLDAIGVGSLAEGGRFRRSGCALRGALVAQLIQGINYSLPGHPRQSELTTDIEDALILGM